MSAPRGDPFIRAFVWSLVVTFALIITALLLLVLRASEPPVADATARRLADRLELDLSRERQSERTLLSLVSGQAHGHALGIEQIEDGVRLVVRVREDADSSGWPCFRLTIHRAGTAEDRSAVERLPSCPVAAPLRPRVETGLTSLEARLTRALELLPSDLDSEAVVLANLINAGLPAASVRMGERDGRVAYVAVGEQPQCVLGYVRPQGEDPSASRVLVWAAPPDRPCSSTTAAEFAGMY
jgi:hypothetical protein